MSRRVIGGMKTKVQYPPVIELFRGEVRRKLLRLAIREGTNDEWAWYNKSDLATICDVSQESIRTEMSNGRRGGKERPGLLVQFGIFEPRDPSGNTVHYRVSNSDVVKMLRASPIDPEQLIDLLASTARQRLMTFFFDHLDESFTKNGIVKKGGSSNDGVDHIDELVDANIVDVDDDDGWTEYQLADTEVVEYLWALNGLLIQTYEEG